MLVGGLDYETNGLDPEKNYVTEIGAVIWDDKDWLPKAQFQRFVFDERALPLSKIIVDLTHITDADVRGGDDPVESFTIMQRFFRDCKAIVSHNKQFEQDFTRTSLKRYSIECDPTFGGIPWLCTNEDLDHSDKRCRKLSHLVVDYGGTVDGTKIHRAIADVTMMGQLLKLIGKPAEELIAFAKEPWVYIQAQTDYNQRDLAKFAGYGWQTCPGTSAPIFNKAWVKRVKQSKFEAEKAKQEPFSRITLEIPG